MPFALLLIAFFLFFIVSITPQTKESSDAPTSVMIISPPSVKDKDQACVGSTSEVVNPIPLNIGYKTLLLL
jgi:hypothetical protein